MASSDLKILGVIPARYDSKRLPGKPLRDILGKTMIRRVYERSIKCPLLDKLVVATDDKRIYNEVLSFGGNCVMTSSEHTSGTSRVCEVAEEINDYDFYINIQGDQPFIKEETIEQICLATKNLKEEIAVMTLVSPIIECEEDDISIAKVVVNKDGRAIYFSRFPIPFSVKLGKFDSSLYLKHLGVYGFTKDVLSIIKDLSPSYLERAESLEQLTWIYENIPVYTAMGLDANKISVDTEHDLDMAIEIARGINDV